MPIIDKSVLPDRLGKKWNRTSKSVFFAMVLVTVLILGAIAGLVIQIVYNGKQHSSEPPGWIPAEVVYTAHGPIQIVGNSGFTGANGVVSGNGTASNPYIISNWAINASHGDGISISDTDAHFIVRNCYVHDGWFGTFMIYYYGIVLSNCVNGTLENNKCTKNALGIFLGSSSHGIALITNNCSSSHYEGIVLDHSSENLLMNNTCSSSTSTDGIGLGFSNNNTLSGNNCSSSVGGVGISLYNSINNTVVNNNCSSNGFHGIYLTSSSANTVSNNICNSNGYRGLFLITSNGNWIVNNTCNLNYYEGALLSSSSDNALRNNSYSNNGDTGMYLLTSSNNNEISGNQILNDVGYGVFLYSGSGNRIWNNTFDGNNGATSTYDALHMQAYDDGTNNWWNSTAARGNWWNDWQSPDNVIPYGIVDLPYNISGSAGAEDYYPLMGPPSNNLPPAYVLFSMVAYGAPWLPPLVFVNESVHFTIVLTDPEHDTIELSWDFGDGSPNTYCNLTDYIDGNVTSEENHTYMAPGNLTVILRFTDNQVGLDNHSVEFEELIRVQVDDVPPVAYASGDQTVVAPTVVHFNGTGSHDDWGDITNYTWTFMLDSTPVTLWGPTPSFEFTEVGTYVVTLNVTDHVGNHNTTTVTIEVVSSIPEFGMMPLVVMVLMAVIVLAGRTRRRKKG